MKEEFSDRKRVINFVERILHHIGAGLNIYTKSNSLIGLRLCWRCNWNRLESCLAKVCLAVGNDVEPVWWIVLVHLGCADCIVRDGVRPQMMVAAATIVVAVHGTVVVALVPDWHGARWYGHRNGHWNLDRCNGDRIGHHRNHRHCQHRSSWHRDIVAGSIVR